jgi:hypothetical protein
MLIFLFIAASSKTGKTAVSAEEQELNELMNWAS